MASNTHLSPKKDLLVERLPLNMEGQYLGLITFNRPHEMNPFDMSTTSELRSVLEEMAEERSVRVIAITGSGKAFSAGGDLKVYLTLMRDAKRFRDFLDLLRSTLLFMEAMDRPVIALVNGLCVAGGLEILLACDFAYAAKSAKIGDGHVNFGQVGGAGSNIRLPRCIPVPRARELLFTGKLLSADEACHWGLINRVVPDHQLLEAGIDLANLIASKSQLSLGIIKRICNSTLDERLEDALQIEIDTVVEYASTSYDSREGLLAFSEKRQPRFEGR